MRKIRSAATLVLFAAVSLLSSCKGDRSPTKAAEEFYSDCNAGKYSAAETLLSPDAKKLFEGAVGASVGGLKGICDIQSKNGTISSMEPINETIRGEGAQVSIMIHYRDGSESQVNPPLIKTNGDWIISTGSS
jgi:hypothetical protein